MIEAFRFEYPVIDLLSVEDRWEWVRLFIQERMGLAAAPAPRHRDAPVTVFDGYGAAGRGTLS